MTRRVLVAFLMATAFLRIHRLLVGLTIQVVRAGTLLMLIKKRVFIRVLDSSYDHNKIRYCHGTK